MTAKDDALASLSESGLLEAFTWAAPVAFARTGQDYDEDAGHTQMVVGTLNFTYMCDLLDRATSNGRYAVPDGANESGRDILGLGIAPEAMHTMPKLPAGRISRSDYRKSPGWAADGYRVLLQSFKYGEGNVDRINWGPGGKAKRQVASQAFIVQAPLFSDEYFGVEAKVGIPEDDFDGVTLVAAHSHDPISGKYKLYIGQSKISQYRGDSCWYWRHQLLDGGPLLERTVQDDSAVLPGNPPSRDVEEISVRLRNAVSDAGLF